KAVDDLGGRIASGDLQFGEFLGANSTTDFVEFGGNFTVENGVVTNDDLKLINDLVSLSGAGTINLPKQNLDYRVDPGQSQDDGGLNVSLAIDGPWTNLSFKPAVGDALKKDIQSQIGEKLGIEEDSQAGKILKGLFGNN
ncbi:MAG: AsmA-like C-terminal region-containing protein, partial [Pseudomonadota bacterium]